MSNLYQSTSCQNSLLHFHLSHMAVHYHHLRHLHDHHFHILLLVQSFILFGKSFLP